MGSALLPVKSDSTIGAGWIQIAKAIDTTHLADFTRASAKESPPWKASDLPDWEVTIAADLTDGDYWAPHPSLFYKDGEAAKLDLFQPWDDSLLSLAGPGRMIEGDRVAWIERGATVTDGSGASSSVRAQLSRGRTTVLSTTRKYDSAYQASTMMMSLGMVWVAESNNSVDDVIWFWNLRALRPVMGGSPPVSVLLTTEDVDNAEIRGMLHDALRDSSSTTPTCMIASSTLPKEVLNETRTALGFDVHDGKRISEGMFRTTKAESAKPSAVLQFDPRGDWLGRRLTGRHTTSDVHLERPAVQLNIDAPVTTIHRSMRHGTWVSD
jgi:hypothetical protein